MTTSILPLFLPRLALTALLGVVSSVPHALEPTQPPPAAQPIKARVRTHAVADFRTCTPPQYPRAAIRKGLTGTVTMAFTIGVDGQVKDAVIKSSSGHEELDQATMNALMKCRFRPATQDGVPIETTSPVQYVWKLDDSKLPELYLHTCLTPMPQPQDGVSRSAVLESLIDATGMVTNTRVIKSSGDAQVDQAAVASQQSCRASPATKDKQRVASWIPVTYFWEGAPGNTPAVGSKVAEPSSEPYFDISHCGPLPRPEGSKLRSAAFILRLNHQGMGEQVQTVAREDTAQELHRTSEPGFRRCVGKPSSTAKPIGHHRMIVRYFWLHDAP